MSLVLLTPPAAPDSLGTPATDWVQYAHDIKNVVASLAMAADELVETGSGREKLLGQRLQKGCSRIIEICAASAGKLSTAPDTPKQCLGQVIDDALDFARQAAGPNTAIGSDSVDLDLDLETAAALFRILSNLSMNAVEAMRQSGGSFNISAVIRDDGLDIDVIDTGPGIAPESSTTERVYSSPEKGWGRGTAIANLLAIQIGARLDLIRTDRRGTAYRLRLPLERR